MAERIMNKIGATYLVGVMMPESGARGWTNGTMWQPRTDVYESREAVIFQIEVPGMEISQLRIHFETEQLTIEGVRPQPECSPNHRCLQVESDYGAFRRVFPLPRNADGTAVSATLELGILNVTVPKKAVEERRIIPIDAK